MDAVGRLFFRKRKFNPKRDDLKRILVIKLDQIGDCFLSVPLFEYLRELFPQADIDVVCQESSAPIFENNPFINDILIFNYPRMYRGKVPAKRRDFSSLIRTVRRKKYDLSIDLRGEPFAALLGFLSGASDRIGFEKEEVGGFFYTQPLSYDRNAHETERYKKIISLLNRSVAVWRPRIYLTDKEIINGEKLVALLSGREYVAVSPGAGVPYKMWPEEKFTEIIRATLKDYGFDVVLLGGKGERRISDDITENVKDGRLKSEIGELSLRESYFMISRAKAFLGNDSVLAHFAGALDIPTVDLMNSVIDENRWHPLGGNVTVILGRKSDHRCRYEHCPYPCPNMQAIGIGEVYGKWDSILRRIKPAAL
jgi:lipopolysaccharide heptosyltransferase II